MPIVGSLFSGIGGLDHGLARAGWGHAFLCESDPWRREVLRARFPGVPVHDDVRDVHRERLVGGGGSVAADTGGGGQAEHAAVDLLCGGFPCQDLSVAGQRRGLAGDRSGLFYEFARIADALRPRWLLIENVPGLLSSNGGRDFGVVLGTLADIGYGLAWRVLDSRFFGVPQRRRRVFIVGAVADRDPRAAAERAGQLLAVGSRCARHPATRGEAGADVAGTLGGGSGERGWAQDTERMTFVARTLVDASKGRATGTQDYVVAAPLSHGSNPNSNMAGRRREDDVNLVAYDGFNHTGGGSKDVALVEDGTPALDSSNHGVGVTNGASVRRLTPTECERLQALPDGWTNPDGKAADSRRYAGLGDAVTASVGEWIGHRIIEAM